MDFVCYLPNLIKLKGLSDDCTPSDSPFYSLFLYLTLIDYNSVATSPCAGEAINSEFTKKPFSSAIATPASIPA